MKLLSSLPPMDVAFLGTSAHARYVRERIRFLAPRTTTVTLVGPTGSGKTLLARELHRLSGRRGRYARVALTQHQGSDLLHSLFAGHVEGAFTGGTHDHVGLVQQAAGGTLFVDELQDADARAQAHLLEIVEQQPLRPLGAEREFRPDVRLVVASQLRLADLVVRKHFRHDLAHRLGVVTILLLPLREHLEDLDVLVPHLLAQFTVREGIAPPPVSPAAMRVLKRYDWPGNVRELDGVLRGAVLDMLCEAPGATTLEAAFLPLPDSCHPPHRRGITPGDQDVAVALTAAGGNVSAAARELGVRRETLSRRVRRLGLQDTVIELRRDRMASEG